MVFNISAIMLSIVIGAALASFLGCIVDNPSKTFSLKGKSSCNHCKKKLQINDLIPIFSFIFLRGKCRYCKKSIKINYLIYEIFMGILFPILWILFRDYYLTSQIFLVLVITSLCYIIYLDWEKMLISIPATVLVLIGSFFIWLFQDYYELKILYSKLFGLVIGFLSLWFINKAYEFFRKRQGIGEGDPLLFAAIGFFVGIELLFFVLVLGAVCGSIYGIILIKYKKVEITDPIPLGSFLGISTIVIYCGSQILQF